MKFKIKSELLKKISKKMNMPSSNLISKIEFTGFLISAFKNKVIFESKGEVISLKAILKEDIEILKEGKILVKAKLFNEIVQRINDEYVDVQTMGDNVLIIKSDNYEYELNLMNVSEFEEENFNIENPQELKIGYNDFKKLFTSVSFSGDITSSRKILQGINLIIKDGVAKALASDNIRATILRLDFKNIEISLNKVIPIKVLRENMNIFEGTKDLTILFSHNKIIITSDEFISKGNLIEGTFPDIERVFPQKFKNYLEINKSEILNLIDGSTVINFNKNSDTNVVKLILDNDQIVFEFRELEIGYSNLKTKNFKFEGDKNFFISFNPRLLREVINNIETDKVRIGFNNFDSPFVIFETKENNFKSLILPYLV